MYITPEEHTDDKKSYLTYDAQSAAIARLLKETRKYEYEAYKDEEMIGVLRVVSKKMRESMETNGFKFKLRKYEKYVGITKFKLPNGEAIPVTVRQVKINGNLNQIRVRITAKTHEELMERTYSIRDTLTAYGLKHKLCVWDRTGSI